MEPQATVEPPHEDCSLPRRIVPVFQLRAAAKTRAATVVHSPTPAPAPTENHKHLHKHQPAICPQPNRMGPVWPCRTGTHQARVDFSAANCVPRWLILPQRYPSTASTSQKTPCFSPTTLTWTTHSRASPTRFISPDGRGGRSAIRADRPNDELFDGCEQSCALSLVDFGNGVLMESGANCRNRPRLCFAALTPGPFTARPVLAVAKLSNAPHAGPASAKFARRRRCNRTDANLSELPDLLPGSGR
jgi:hypothetical protein